jgi:hypothetical protein
VEDDVRLVLESDGTYSWHCERCGVTNTMRASHLGYVACQCCKRSSFITEVVR